MDEIFPASKSTVAPVRKARRFPEQYLAEFFRVAPKHSANLFVIVENTDPTDPSSDRKLDREQ